MRMPSPDVRIGIIGDFNPEFRSHHATNDSLQHAGRKLKLSMKSEWVGTPQLETSADALSQYDGLWASPGSPYQSMEGMLRGIQFARERDWPFLGTCGGFQYTLIEVARHVSGVCDADSAENNSGSKNVVIYPVSCAVPNRAPEAPKLSGRLGHIALEPGSRLRSIYGIAEVEEEFFCNFEINPAFQHCFEEAGLRTVARGADGEIRAVESATHRFFIATLFQPQLSSTASLPHALVLGFVQAAADFARLRSAAFLGHSAST